MKDKEIDEEIQAHIQMAIRDRMARGESEKDARAAVMREFGNVGLVKETTRAVWTHIAIEQLLQDLRFACRIVTRSPGLTATAVFLIAIVIGVNTTMYSLIHSVLTNPAPGVNPADLVSLGVSVDGRVDDPANSYPNYLDYAAQTRTLSHLVIRTNDTFNVGTPDGNYEIAGDLTSPNYFDALGIALARGRNFADDDNRPDAPLIAIISHRLWQSRFNGTDDAIGRSISLNGHAVTVIGVAAEGFNGPEMVTHDIWVPVVPFAAVAGMHDVLVDRAARVFTMYGRLAPGYTVDDAQLEFDLISESLQAAYPEALTRFGGEMSRGNMGAVVVPYSAFAFVPIVRFAGPFLAVFGAITLLTLLIVSANVANLMLARAVVRQRELAVRQSLGASRFRILRVLVAEGLVISTLSWVAATVFAFIACELVVAMIPPDGTRAALNFQPDLQVLSVAMLMALTSTILFMTAPAIRAWRQDLLPWLKAGETAVVQGRSRISTMLVVAQLAFSVVLLTAAGLAFRSLSLIDRPEDLGFNKDNLLLVSVNTEDSVETAEANGELLDRVRERLAGIPGIESASYARRLGGPLRPMTVRRADSEIAIATAHHFAGPDHLRALGVTPLLGRDFDGLERTRANASVIVSQNLAQSLWGGESPIGQPMAIGAETDPRGSLGNAEVVGVIPDGFYLGPSTGYPNFIYISAQQAPTEPGTAVFYLRHSTGLDSLTPAIGAALDNIDSRMAIVEMSTMAQRLEATTYPARIATLLILAFSAGSLGIAIVGQYAAVAFNMRRRTRDFALRLALGASSRQILTSVLREGMAWTAIGLIVGLTLSLAMAQIARNLLFGITPTDLPTYVGVFIVLAGTSFLACYLPARRAARMDPARALRQE